MAHKCVFILATLATSGAFAVPLNNWNEQVASATCATTCPVNTKFSFEAGQTYEYRYESDVQTTMGGASEEHSSLHMRSTIQLEVLSRCELVLKVSEVSLQDSNPSQYESRQHVERASEFQAALQQNDLRFAYLDGQVENICPQEEEATWVLNIKRGILSTLQNSMEALDTDKRLFEKDIVGNCPTEYEALGKSWSTRKVKKTKDIIGCMERSGPHSAFQGTPFTSESDIQSLPLMKSTHECEQEINSAGIISMSECTETHVFRPFSRHDNGAKTEVTSRLSFNRQFAGVSTRDGPVRYQLTLSFDHTLSETEVADNLRDAKVALSDLCTASADDIRPEVPALFTQFIRNARKLETRHLSRLFSTATNGLCLKAERYFRDAIPMIGTTASVNLIRELIENNKVEDLEAEIWLTSISTSITRPNKDMITALKPLLTGDPSRKTFLTVSSLVNNYCRVNGDCDTDSDVQEIVGIYEGHLRYNCRVESEEQHEEVMMALKSLGNTGHAGRSASSLVRCASNSETSMELRVAALQAFRRMPCMVDRPEIFNILEDTVEDAELRIQAYLTLMGCPDQVTINRMRNILESETVNQVGSFIWTHLTNLMETSNPHKQDIRMILEKEALRKEFDMDKRKFSRNMEWSLFSELVNMGGSAESNLIWSQDSFLPRSAALNLTVDMFGQSINLLELGTRMQGMEQMLEKVFGSVTEETNSVQRSKRAAITDDAINSLDNKYDAKRDDPQVSYFLRLFGNEIRYGDLHNFDMTGLQDKVNFLEFLINLASDHDFEVTKSIMFLDATTSIPTIAGMPLKLEADGAASINMHIRGKMDIRRMFTSPSHFDIEGSISPSAALEVTSQMGVDAFVARTGLKMVSTLHTSTILQGKVQLKEGRELEFDFDVPKDQMEILSAQSKFYVVWREDEREQNMLTTPQADNAKCIGGKFSTVFGLELCGELTYPYDTSRTATPFFPLTGPVTAKVYLNKRETYTGFHFETKYIQEKTRSEAGVQITDVAKIQFDTPESQVDRELTMEFSFNRATKALSFNLRTPWKKADINSAIVSTAVEKSFTIHAVVDEVKQYSLTAQVNIDDRESALRYEPSVIVVIPDRQNIRLEGEVLVRPNRKYDMDMSLRNLFTEPVRVKGSIDKLNNNRRMKYGIELEIASSLIQSKIEGFLDHNKANGNSMAARVELEYQYGGGEQQRLVFSNKMRRRSTDSQRSYSLDTAWSTTMFPSYNGEVSVDYTMGNGAVTTSIQAGLDEDRKIVFTQTATYVFGTNTTVNGEARFQFPLKDLDYTATVNHQHSRATLNSQASIRSAENTEGSLSVVLNKKSMTPLKVNGAIHLHYPGREMSWTESIDELTAGKYHHNLEVQLQKYQTIEFASIYTKAQRHELTATLNVPDYAPMSIDAHLNPELLNIESGVEITAFQKTYSAGYNHSFRGTMAAFAAQSNARMSWPEQQMTSTTNVGRRGDVITVTTESSWASDKKITFEGEMTLSKTAPATTMRLTWPQNFVTFALQGNIKHQGWYNTEDDLEASMQLTSSFTGLEQISASLKHDITTATALTEVEVSWAQGKKVDVSFNLNKVNGNSQVESSVQINTPFIGYRTMHGELIYNLEGTTLTTTTTAEWEDNQITLEAEGEITIGSSRLLRGSATLVTPFMDRITISGRHSDDGSQYETQMQTTWAPSKQVSAQFTMRHQNSDRRFANNAEITIVTPFSILKQGKISTNYLQNDRKISAQIEVERDGQTGTLEVDAMHKETSSKRSLHLKTALQTPFTNYEDMQMTIEHQHSLINWEGLKSDVSGQWGSQVMAYSHEVDINRHQANIKASFMSPFTSPVAIDLANQFSNEQFAMSNSVLYNGETMATLEGRGSSGDAEGDFTLQWTCRSQDITLTANYQLENGIYTARKSLVYAPGKEIIMDSTFGWEDVKTGSIHLRSPCPYLQDVSLSSRFTGNLHTFEGEAELEHDLLDSKLAIIMALDTADLNNIHGDFEYQGHNGCFAKSTLSRIANGAGRHQHSATFEIPNFRSTISNDMTIMGWDRHTTETTIEYNAGKRIELSSMFHTTPKVEGQVSLTTPWDQVRNAAINFNHEGTASSFETSASVNYNDMRMSADTTFAFTGTSLTASTTLITPFPGMNRIEAQLTHTGGLKNFNNNMVVSYDGQQLRSSSEFAFEADGLTGSLVLSTPYEVLNTLRITFDHSFNNYRSFANNMAVDYNDYHYSGNSELRWYGQTFRSKVAVNIPTEYSLKVNSKGRWTDCSNTVTIKMGDNTISGNSAFKYGTNLLETTSTLTTPFVGFENFDVSINHEGAVDNFRTSASLVTPFQAASRQGFEVSHQGTLSNFQSSLRVDTPFEVMPTALFTINHEGTITQFTTRANAEYRGQTITSEVHFSSVEAIEGSARLTTTYTGLRNFLATFTHSGVATNFRTAATIETPFENFHRMSASYNHNGNLQGFNCEGLVETSYPGFETINLEISHLLPGEMSIISSLEVRTSHPDYPRIAAAISHAGNWVTMRSSASLETPFNAVPRVSYNIDHDISNLRRIRSEIQATTTVGDFSYIISHQGNSKVFSTDVVVTSPFVHYQRFEITMNHNARSLEDITNNVQMETPQGNFGYGFRHQGNADAFVTSLEVTTPLDGYDRLSLNMDHRMSTWSNIDSRSTLSTPKGTFGYHAIHNGSPSNMQSSFEVTTPYAAYNRYRVNIEHSATDLNNIRSSSQLITPHGDSSYSLTHSGSLDNMRSTLEVLTPFTDYNRFSLALSHSHTDVTDVQSSATLTTPMGDWRYELRHTGGLPNMVTTLDFSTPSMVIGVNSEVSYISLNNFRSNAELRTPLGVFSHVMSHNGNMASLQDNIQINTPFVGYERFSANIEHNAEDLTNLRSNVQVTTPFGDYSHAITNRGDLSDMETSVVVSIPLAGYERWTINSEKGIVSSTNIRSSVRFGSPYGLFTYSLSHRGTAKTMRSSFEATSPFPGFERFAASIQNNIQSWTDLSSEASANTPLGDFAYTVSHSGDLKTMTSSLTLTTPFTVERFSVNIANNIQTCTNFRSTATMGTPLGDFDYTIIHNGNLKTMTSSLIVNTPLSGYERFSVNVENDIQSWANIKSSVRVGTPKGEFSYNIDHNGDFARLTHVTEITTPFAGYERLSVNLDHESQTWKIVKSNARINTPMGEFTFTMDHNGDHSRMVHTSEVTTPLAGYERFGAEIDHNAQQLTNVRSSGSIRTSVGSFGYSLTHTGDLKNMRSNAEVTTPFTGYERTTIRIENNIRSKTDFSATATVGTSLGDFEYAINHNGNLKSMNSGLTVSTPFSGYERFSVNVVNNIQSSTNFRSTVTVGTHLGDFAGTINHHGDLETMTSSLTVNTPFSGYERFSVNVENNIRSSTNIRSTAGVETPLGAFSYSIEHIGTPSQFTHTTEVTTPFTGYERMSAVITHASPSMSDVRSSGRISCPTGGVSYSIEHRGDWQVMQGNYQISTPISGHEHYGIIVDLNASDLTNIQYSEQVITPHGNFAAEFTHTGTKENFRSTFEITTPLDGYRRYSGSLVHNASNLPTIATSANLNAPQGEFTASFNHEGSLQNFRSSLSINTPYPGYERFSLALENNCEDKSNINTVASLSLPEGAYTATLSHTGNIQTFRSSFGVTTPIARYEAVVDHSASDLSNIVNSLTITAPRGTFGYRLNHNGNLESFRSNLEINTPFEEYRSFGASIEHSASSFSNIQTTARLTTPRGIFGVNIDHTGSQKNIRTTMEMTTPLNGLERFALTLTHSGTSLAALNSELQMTTPVGSYGYSLTHEGSGRNFHNELEIVTPHESFSRIKVTTSLNAMSMNNLSSSMLVETPVGQFGYSVSREGNGNGFTNEAEITTPFAPYNKFTGLVQFNRANAIETSAVITTTVPDYERFSLGVSVGGNKENFQVTVEAQTSIPGYSRFSLHLEHSGGVVNPKFLLNIRTPLPGYEIFGVTFEKTGTIVNLQAQAEVQSPFGTYGIRYNHRGSPSDFVAQGSIETSVSGYERFALELSFANDRRLRSSIQIDTPFRGYNQFRARLMHGRNGNNMRSSLTINTPISGYEEFSASLNNEIHEGGFTSEIRAQTPIAGYRNFGMTMTHTGDFQNFQTRGTISLPIESLPELVFSATRRETDQEFQITGSIEYNGKAIEIDSTFRKNYEVSFQMNSPCPWFQDLSINAAHTNNGDMSTGRLDITHNGVQNVDLDYSYTSSSINNINVELRKPYPMATRLNFGGQSNEASVNWDTTATDKNVNIQFNLRNDNTEKEAMLRVNLPHRIVGFTFNMANTAERIAQTTEVMWNNLPETRVMYHVEMSKTTRRRQNMYDGQFSLTTPLGNFQSTFNHRSTPGSQYTTEIAIQQLNLRANMVKSGATCTHTLSAAHPILPSNTQLVIESTLTDLVTEGRIELSYDQHVIAYTGRVADESSSGTTLYTARTQLTHSASNLDFQWNGELRVNRESRQANMEASYLTSYDLQRKTASLRAEIQRLRNEISIQVVTPLKSVSINARENTHDTEQAIHIFEVTLSNDQNQMRGEIEVNGAERSLSIKAFRNEDNYVEMHANVMGVRQAQAEIFRMNDGTKHQVAMASFSLSEDQLVSTRFFLCPQLSNEMKALYKSLIRRSDYTSILARFNRAFNSEVELKRSLFLAAIEPLTPTIDVVRNEMNRMNIQASNTFNQMYNDDHFHMRTIHQTLSPHFADMSARVQYHLAEAKVTLARNMAIAHTHLRATWLKVVDACRNNVLEFVSRMVDLFNDYSPYMNNILVDVRDAVLNVIETVQNNPTLKWAWNKWQTFDMDALMESINMVRDYAMSRYSPAVDRVKALYAYANSFPETKYIVAYAKRVYLRSKFTIEYMELMERMKHLIYELHQINLDTYRADLVETIRNYLQLERTRWTVWNPATGEIGFDLYWPFHWDDLKHLDRLQALLDTDVSSYLNMAKDEIIQLMPHPEFTLSDYFYKYKPSADVFNWVPPFKSRAAIVGDQHYMTFDKKFYEFAGECSYLLARDFIDGAFSVVVNYRSGSDGASRRSITVFSNNKQVEVLPDARVIVDGTRVEMPLTFQNTSIIRMGHVIRIDNTKGVTVDCHLIQNRCTVNVTGWYFSKTAGMFGTYNNEPADDLMMSGNRIASNLAQFADSWTAGSRCTAVNRARVVTAAQDTQQHRVCANLFESTISTMRPCFKVVDPAPFMIMCVNDIPTNVNHQPTEQDTCRIAAFYVDECRREGVPVRVPKTCVRCEVESLQTEVSEGQNITLRGDSVPQSADVVFVVQHASCNQEVVNMIKASSEDLNNAFLAKNIRKNRFAIVGYGAEGRLNAPHVHTMDGQIFNTHDKILVGLDNFEREASPNADGFAALRYAAKLPFRAGVSKTLVLVPCSNCTEKTVGYGEIQQSLKKLSVNLHVLMPHTFELAKDKDVVSAYIFGADSERVFTRRDAGSSELEGDRELRQQLMVPKDLCAALAMETEGSVFNTLQWTESRPYMQKRFVDVLVRLIAQKGVPEECQNCDCVADETGVGKTVCQTCESTRSLFSFLPGFGESGEISAEAHSSEEANVPDFSFEETTPNPRRLRMLNKGKKASSS